MATFTATGEMLVNTINANDQYGSYRGGNITYLADGGWVVVFTSESGTGASIKMQRYDAFGQKVGTETLVSTFAGFHLYPTVATLDNGTFVVTWTSVTDPDNNPETNPTFNQDGSGSGVYMQRFNANGTKIGVETRVNTTTEGNQDVGLVTALSDGGFIVTWDGQDGSDYGVFAQRYNASGATVGGEFRVNTTTASFQDYGSVLVLNDGSLIIMWESAGQDNGTAYGVYMQRYSAAGVAQGGEVRVNTTVADQQGVPKGTVLSNGDFIITWASAAQDYGSGYGIYMQRYTQAGVAVGGETLVNTTIVNHQYLPTIAALNDGGFVVVWQSNAQDGSNPVSNSIYMQQYNAAGAKVGVETRVNEYTVNAQSQPAVTVLDNGNFVITWQSFGQDGSEWGVYQRIFYVNNTINDPNAGGNTITGSGETSDVINGLDGNDTLSTGPGFSKDTLNGGEGDDLLNFSGGDEAHGGNGNDTLRLLVANGFNVFITGGAGYDILDATPSPFGPLWNFTNTQLIEEYRGSAFNDVFNGSIVTNTAMLILGNNGNDALQGGSLNDTLNGGDGDDALYGYNGNDGLTAGIGNDLLNGMVGADTMTGGVGNDTYYVDNAGDVLVEAANEGSDYVFSSISFSLVGREIEGASLLDGANLTLTGNAYNNYLAGNFGNNAIDGGAGADTMVGGSGNDTFVVDNVGDTFLEPANAGIDTIQTSLTWSLAGLQIENILLTGTANLNATGNTFNNVLVGNAGDNTLTGGIGNDTYFVQNTADKVVEAENEGKDTVVSDVTYSLAGQHIEEIFLTGAAHINAIGNGLDNVLSGSTGNNTLTAGAGNDTLDGAAGVDTLIGGVGNDTYYVENSLDRVTEAQDEGLDLVFSTASFSIGVQHVEIVTLTGSGNINATGNNIANSLYGNSGINILDAKGGNDVLDGGVGADVLIGGTGDDSYVVDNIGDVVTEAANQGFDWIFSNVSYTAPVNIDYVSLTGTADINATGNSLVNGLYGNSGNNILDAKAGNDLMNGGEGADTMIGGTGNDTYYIDNVGDRITEVDGEGTDTVFSSATVSVAAWSIETVTLTGSANIDVNANALNNLLTGNTGNNVLNGRSGADTMIGGLGNDSYYVDNIGDRVTEAADQGTDTVFAGLSFSVAAQAVENVTLTGSADIEAIGNGLANILTGNGGGNSLNGRTGADTLIGGGGSDTYYVDNVGDVVTELSGQGVDSVISSISFSLAGLFVEQVTLNGSANNNATGNSFNNIITGNSGNNRIDGGAGGDRMYGGLGNDTFVVDDVTDKPTEKANEGYDTLMTSVTFSVAAQNIEAITQTGSGNIDIVANALDNVITGNSGNNVLNGRSGNDTISGGAGRDTLIGSTGNDVLTGGSGLDIFLFSGSSGIDTVTDFSKAQGDKIDLNDITGGVANATIVTQSGSDVTINFGGGNILTIEDAVRADVLTQIVW